MNIFKKIKGLFFGTTQKMVERLKSFIRLIFKSSETKKGKISSESRLNSKLLQLELKSQWKELYKNDIYYVGLPWLGGQRKRSYDSYQSKSGDGTLP